MRRHMDDGRSLKCVCCATLFMAFGAETERHLPHPNIVITTHFAFFTRRENCFVFILMLFYSWTLIACDSFRLKNFSPPHTHTQNPPESRGFIYVVWVFLFWFLVKVNVEPTSGKQTTARSAETCEKVTWSVRTAYTHTHFSTQYFDFICLLSEASDDSEIPENQIENFDLYKDSSRRARPQISTSPLIRREFFTFNLCVATRFTVAIVAGEMFNGMMTIEPVDDLMMCPNFSHSKSSN